MIRFIVDSTFGIEEDYAKTHNIEIVNLKLVLEGRVTEEGFEKDWQEFYERLKASKAFPTTSQPSPQDFTDAIEKIIKEDSDAEIVILTISSALSSTVNSARLGAEGFEGKKIAVIDSGEATACQRLMLEELVEAAQKGLTFEEMPALVEELQEKLSIYFVPSTMEYLKRGGRIGVLSATLASILQIKPIFRFKKGAISITKKVLGFGRALKEMTELVSKKIKKLYICYIHDKTNIDLLVQKVKQVLGFENFQLVSVSPVFGVHVGIGAVGLAALEY